MPLKHRFTHAGQQKQLADERAAWRALAEAANGTPHHATILAIGTWGGGGVCTNVNDAHPQYAQWRAAHKILTKRARRERQRRQAAMAANGGLPNHPPPLAHLPCQVNPAIVARDTIRAAIMHTGTREGGATRLNPGGLYDATTPQLLTHLKRQLKRIEAVLSDVVAHQETHDLRALGHPPLQVFLTTEWYFRPAGRPHTAAEKANILAQLQALSRRFADWLIVPGSIYWSPDPLGNATVRVYNSAVALWAGSILVERRKRESHDIDHAVGYHERWGPDEIPADVGVPIPSTQAGFFTLHGRHFCLEICRDQRVGDALEGCLLMGVGPAAGAHVHLFTSNGTTVTDGFLPVRDQGLVLFCDGGGHNQRYLRVTRVNPPNHAPNIVPFTNYRLGFNAERTLMASAYRHMDNVTLFERAPGAHLTTFLAKYDALYAVPSSDPVLQGAINLAVAAVVPAPAGVNAANWTKGLRIQQILAGGVLPNGVPIPPNEIVAATPYAAALVGSGHDLEAASATNAATAALHLASTTQFNVAVANAFGGTVPIPNGAADLTVYDLVDL
ncbi:MAG: hypothetical protein R3B70_25370 [Polyangiaceae bacterium]